MIQPDTFGREMIFMYDFQHILIATDFSPAAWQAIKAGVSLAKIPSAKIVLLHVFPNRIEQLDETERTHFNNVKQKISKIAEDLGNNHGLEIESAILNGNIPQVITKFVKENNIDLVLMGANSSNMDSHLGRHTTLVIESSPSPVMVIPPLVGDMENAA